MSKSSSRIAGVLCFLGFVAFAGTARNAAAFCRSGTCKVPEGYEPTRTECRPPSSDMCVINKQTVRSVPTWWRPACVGYSIQREASKAVSVDDVTMVAARAFAAWSSRSCPTDGTGTSRVTIDARDLGPVICGTVGYQREAANQNVIVFRDEVWPHEKSKDEQAAGSSRTIALTTLTFDPNTGEIYDADIEINSADHSVIVTNGGKLGENVYDLESVLTHEVGHFFGLAHSPDPQAVMFPRDQGGEVSHRDLTTDDITGICTLYPPNGLRPVDAMINASGVMAAGACDPTPRHGFSSECATAPAPSPDAQGCSVVRPGLVNRRDRERAGSRDVWVAAVAVAFAALGVSRRRSRRSWRSSQSLPSGGSS